MERVTTIPELIHVAFAIDAHTERIDLDGYACAQTVVTIDGVESTSLVELAAYDRDDVTVRAEVEVERARAWDVVELELAQTRLIARSHERAPTMSERHVLRQSGATTVRIPVGAK